MIYDQRPSTCADRRLLERAAGAVDAEDRSRVVDLATRVLSIAPDHPDAQALIAMGEAGHSAPSRPAPVAEMADARCVWCATVIEPTDKHCRRGGHPRGTGGHPVGREPPRLRLLS